MKGFITTLGPRLFLISLACGLPAGKPHANAIGLADSNDDYSTCPSHDCSSSCDTLATVASFCSLNNTDSHSGPYDTDCLCLPTSDFIAYYPACLECGWTLWDSYASILTQALSACQTLPTEPTGSTRCPTATSGASQGINTGNPAAITPEETTPASNPELSGEYVDGTLVWSLTIPSTYGPLKSVSLAAEKKPYIRDDYSFTSVELTIDGKSTEDNLFTNITDDQVYANYSGAFADNGGSSILNIYANPYAEYEWSTLVQATFVFEDGTYGYAYGGDIRISAPDMPSTTSMLPTASPVLSGHYVDDELTWEVEFPGAAGVWSYVSVWITRNGTEYDGYNFTDAAGYINGAEIERFRFSLYGPSTGLAYCYENPDQDDSLILLFNTEITNGTVWVATADITLQALDQEGSYVWSKVRATVSSTSASPTSSVSSAESSSVKSSPVESSPVESSSVESSPVESSSVESSSVSSSTASPSTENPSSKTSSSISPETSNSSPILVTQTTAVRPTSTPSSNDFNLSGFQEGEDTTYSGYGDLVWTLSIPEHLGPWISLYVTFSNNGTENNQYSYKSGLGYTGGVNTFNQSMLTPNAVSFQVPGNIWENNSVNFAVSGEPYPDTSIWTSIVTILMEVPYDTRLSKRSSFLEWTLEATIEGNATISSSETLISSSETLISSSETLISSSMLLSSMSSQLTSEESVETSTSQTSTFSEEPATTSTSTVEDISTTVITITSCDEDICITTGVTTGVTIVTTTEFGVVSSYTTYCPTTTEFYLKTTVITITSCEEDICTEIPVTTGVTTITTTEEGKLATYTTFCEVPEPPKVYTQVVTSFVESCVDETCKEVTVTKTIEVTGTTSKGGSMDKTSEVVTETVALKGTTITRTSTKALFTGMESGEEITQAMPVNTNAAETTNTAGPEGATTSSSKSPGSTSGAGTAESEVALTTFEGSATSVISNSILAIAVVGILVF